MNEMTSFAIMAIIALLAAIGVVAFKSPVRSALSLVGAFFALAMIYFSLGAQLLGISQIMVYAGAIMVLFLFVIMILRLGSGEKFAVKTDKRIFIAIPVALVLGGLVVTQFAMPISGSFVEKSPDAYGLPQAVGPVLFTTYVWPFELASLLLLIGVVGSIMLAKRRF